MFKTILTGIAIIIVALVVIASMRPSEFSVTRSATFNAAPAAIFPHINNLHNWQAWSPWARLDPNAKTSFEGPDAGVGAIMRWDGDHNVGAGSMTIVDSRPGEAVGFQLDFLKPFKGTNSAEFTLQPKGNQTLVTWSMSGRNNFIAKLIGLFIDCEKMVGEQFEKGLENLRVVAEAPKKS